MASKVWQMVPMEMKNLKSLKDFKNKIKRLEPDGCDCKLCKDFMSNLGYVSLVWLWYIRLTISILKFCLIWSAKKYLLCRHLSAWKSKCGDCCGVWNDYGVNDWWQQNNVNDVALVSVLLTLGLFHGLSLCFFCWFWAVNFRLFRHAPFALKFSSWCK